MEQQKDWQGRLKKLSWSRFWVMDMLEQWVQYNSVWTYSFFLIKTPRTWWLHGGLLKFLSNARPVLHCLFLNEVLQEIWQSIWNNTELCDDQKGPAEFFYEADAAYVRPHVVSLYRGKKVPLSKLSAQSRTWLGLKGDNSSLTWITCDLEKPVYGVKPPITRHLQLVHTTMEKLA